MEIYHKYIVSAVLCIAPLCWGANNTAHFDDWIISETCSKDANKLCHGYYRQPIFPEVTSNMPQPVEISSEEASLVAKGTSVFTGNVKAVQGDKIIYADSAEVVHNSDTGELESITATGNVRIMQPGIRADSTQAIAYIGEERKTLDHVVYRIYERHARGTADNAEILQSDRMILCHASYTTCAPGSNAWYLKSSTTKFNKTTGRGEAWNSVLFVKDVPIFYYPYLDFPIDKRRYSGFLQPEFETSTENGTTFIVPYYFNLAPNYDLTTRTSYMAKRSWKFDNNFRYLMRNSYGSIKFDFLPHDREYQALRNTQYSNLAFMTSQATALQRNDLKPRDFRYGLTFYNNTRLARGLEMIINYTTASDGNYFYDFSEDETAQIYALQEGILNYSGCIGNASLKVQQYQTFYVTDGPQGVQQLSKMPTIAYLSPNVKLTKRFIFYSSANYSNFIPKIIPDNTVQLSYAQRTHVKPGIQYNYAEPGWFVKPRVQLHYLNYSDLHITPANQASGVSPRSSNTFIPIYDVDSGLIFERSMRNDWIQTLEPKLYYLYVPTVNQDDLPVFDSALYTFDYNQIWRDNRYTGLDRVSEANQISFGLASKVYNSRGEEVAMFGIGQIYYFHNILLLLDTDQDYTYKKWSPLAAIATLRMAPEYNLTVNWVNFRTTPNIFAVQFQYRPDPFKVINFGYELAPNANRDDLTGQFNTDVQQINVSTAWQITAPLRFLGRVNYDLRFGRNLNTLIGVEYHSCCTEVRLLWNSVYEASTLGPHQHRNSFHIQFIFKGLAGVGNAKDAFIAKAIPGYKAIKHF